LPLLKFQPSYNGILIFTVIITVNSCCFPKRQYTVGVCNSDTLCVLCQVATKALYFELQTSGCGMFCSRPTCAFFRTKFRFVLCAAVAAASIHNQIFNPNTLISPFFPLLHSQNSHFMSFFLHFRTLDIVANLRLFEGRAGITL